MTMIERLEDDDPSFVGPKVGLGMGLSGVFIGVSSRAAAIRG